QPDRRRRPHRAPGRRRERAPRERRLEHLPPALERSSRAPSTRAASSNVRTLRRLRRRYDARLVAFGFLALALAHMLEIARSASPTATHRRPLLAECRIRERLQGLVQRRELVRDPQELLVRVETPRGRVHLVAETIEPLEQSVELPVAYLALVHAFILGRPARRASARRVRPHRAASAAAPAHRRRSRARRRGGPRRAAH